MPYDPNEPRDWHGRWTDAGISEPVQKKMQSGLDEEKRLLGFAPFREQAVFTEELDREIRDSPEYKLYLQNVSDLANQLGVQITDSMNSWGGYPDTNGNPITEVSNMIHVQGDPGKVDLMAAVLGESAPEVQAAVLVSHYTPQGNGIEVTIGTNGLPEKIIPFLKKNNIDYFSINKDNGDVIILDMDRSNIHPIITFAKDLKANDLLTKFHYTHVDAKFIEQTDYRQIIEGSGRNTGAKNGFDADAFVQKARSQYQKIQDQKK